MKLSEKRLLFSLLALLLLGGVLVCTDVYLDKRDALLAEQTRLETEWIEIETLLEERELWEIRSTWLAEKQPGFSTTEAIDQTVYRESLADDLPAVRTSRQSLLPNTSTDHYVQAGVALSASGDLPDVFEWIHSLTPPDSFRLIRNLKISPDKENPAKVVAQFELLRWYTPKNP